MALIPAAGGALVGTSLGTAAAGIGYQVLSGVIGEATGSNPNPGGRLIIDIAKKAAQGYSRLYTDVYPTYESYASGQGQKRQKTSGGSVTSGSSRAVSSGGGGGSYYYGGSRGYNWEPMSKRKAEGSGGGRRRWVPDHSAPAPQMVMFRPIAQTKFFDTTGNSATGTGADWASTEIACDSYIQSDGTTVGAYTDCGLIPSAVGAGYGQLNGNKYWIKRIRIQGQIQTPNLADQNDVGVANAIRLSLVWDHQSNGAQAQGENIYTDLGDATQCTYSFLQMGAAMAGRFRILKNKIAHANLAAVGTDGASTNSVGFNAVPFHFTYTPRDPIPVRIQANSATPTVAALADTNIFLLCHSTIAANVIFAARCYYVD